MLSAYMLLLVIYVMYIYVVDISHSCYWWWICWCKHE